MDCRVRARAGRLGARASAEWRTPRRTASDVSVAQVVQGRESRWRPRPPRGSSGVRASSDPRSRAGASIAGRPASALFRVACERRARRRRVSRFGAGSGRGVVRCGGRAEKGGGV